MPTVKHQPCNLQLQEQQLVEKNIKYVQIIMDNLIC